MRLRYVWGLSAEDDCLVSVQGKFGHDDRPARRPVVTIEREGVEQSG
jgi:hypothetical protein